MCIRDRPFSASDDVIVLEPLAAEATEDALLILVTLITHQCVPKFGFGYKLTLHRLGRQKILLPVTTDDDGKQVADWAGMARVWPRAACSLRAATIGGAWSALLSGPFWRP